MRQVIIALFAVALLAGCTTLKEHETSARLVTQYATLKYLERYSVAARTERSERIRLIAADVKTFAAGETTLTLLHGSVASRLDQAGLSPADRLLADGLVQIIVAELQQRIGAGVLSAEQLVVVNEVLDWIIQATQMAA